MKSCFSTPSSFSAWTKFLLEETNRSSYTKVTQQGLLIPDCTAMRRSSTYIPDVPVEGCQTWDILKLFLWAKLSCPTTCCPLWAPSSSLQLIPVFLLLLPYPSVFLLACHPFLVYLPCCFSPLLNAVAFIVLYYRCFSISAHLTPTFSTCWGRRATRKQCHCWVFPVKWSKVCW